LERDWACPIGAKVISTIYAAYVSDLKKSLINVIELTFSHNPALREDLLQYASKLPTDMMQRDFLSSCKKLSDYRRQYTEFYRQQPSDAALCYSLLNESISSYDKELDFHQSLANIIITCASEKDLNRTDNQVNDRRRFNLFMCLMMDAINDKGYRINILKHSIEKDPTLLNSNSNSWGNTIFLYDISNAEFKVCLDNLEYLQKTDPIHKCHVDINLKSVVFGTAPLHLAIGKGYRSGERDANNSKDIKVSCLDLAKKLIEIGADVNLKTNSTAKIEKEHLYDGTMELICQGGQTALHIACARHDLEAMDFLKAHGADESIKNDQGQTPGDIFLLPVEERRKIVNNITGFGLNNFDKFQS